MMLTMAKQPDPRKTTRYADGMATISLKIHEDIRKPLKARADADGVKVSDVVREALVAYLKLPPETTRVVGRTVGDD